jgi:predicted metal-dependent hydrolase
VTNYPDGYIYFLYLFNHERDYYECHDVLEDLWLEEGREPFYQGLLQVAVGLYHLENGNLGGAEKLLSSALEKLSLYPDEHMGIQVSSLRRSVLDLKESLPSVQLPEFQISIVDPVLKQRVAQFNR